MKKLLLSLLGITTLAFADESWLVDNALETYTFNEGDAYGAYSSRHDGVALSRNLFTVQDGLLKVSSGGMFIPFPQETEEPIYGAVMRIKCSVADGEFDFWQMKTMLEGTRYVNFMNYIRYDHNTGWMTVFLDFGGGDPQWQQRDYKGLWMQQGHKAGRSSETDYLSFLSYAQFQEYQKTFGEDFIWLDGHFGGATGFTDADQDGLSDVEEEHFLGTNKDKYDPPAIAEIGSVTLDTADTWLTVRTEGVYETPVVIAQANPTLTIVTRSIDRNTFQVKASPTEGSAFTATQVNFLVAEQGSYTLADGRAIQTGETLDGTLPENLEHPLLTQQDESGALMWVSVAGEVFTETNQRFLGFFATDSDQDGDGLLDEWQRSNRISDSGYYGDDDGDGLLNYQEYRADTSAYLTDTDGDGRSDYTEVVELNQAHLATRVGPFRTIRNTIKGADFTDNFGTFLKEGERALQDTRRGSVTYKFTAMSKGVHAAKVYLTSITKGSYSRAYEVIVSLNGNYVTRRTVNIDSETSRAFTVLLPSLIKGEDYTLDLFIDNSHNYRYLSIDKVEIKDASGADRNSNTIPDWEEFRVQSLNGADSQEVNSYVSPACIQGKVEHFDFLESTADLQKLPNDRWYANIPLEQSIPTEVTNTYEGRAIEETITVNWIGIDPTTFTTDLQIREGDSLLLTQASTINGTAQASGTVPFTVAGAYTITAGENSFLVEVKKAPRIAPTVVIANHARDWNISYDDSLTMLHDDAVKPYLSTKEKVLLDTKSLEDSLIAFSTKSGLILNTVEIIHNRLRAASETGFLMTDIPAEEGYEHWAVPFVLDKKTNGLTVISEIFIGGVTFQDGRIVNELHPHQFDEFGVAQLIYKMPTNAHSNCHRNRVTYQGVNIARYH